MFTVGWRVSIVLAVLSAALLIASFPRHDLGGLAWISLIPLFTAIRGKGPLSAFLVCYLPGILFNMGVFYWINILRNFSPVDFILLSLYFGSYFAIFGLLHGGVSRNTSVPSVLSAPAIWVSLEYVRSNMGFLGLPWALLGHTQYLNLTVLQAVSFTGVYGITFLVVAVNMFLAEAVSMFCSREAIRDPAGRVRPAVWALSIPPLLLAITVAHGMVVLRRGNESEERFRVTVVQGNIPQGIKWNPEYRRWTMDRYADLTLAAYRECGGKTDLIAWPETAIPGYLVTDPYFQSIIDNIASTTRTHLLVGSAELPKLGQKHAGKLTPARRFGYFNSALLFGLDRRIEDRYEKIHLLPFGEYLPLRGFFPWPERIALNAGTYTPGNRHTIFRLGEARFSVLICWESLFPDLTRRFVREGAQFLVNMANEAWFGETAAPYQFLSMNVFRAVENRIPLARSTNTGVSCIISPTGEIMGKVQRHGKDIFVEGNLTMEIPLLREKTFYTLYGDVFSICCIMCSLILLVLSLAGTGKALSKGDR